MNKLLFNTIALAVGVFFLSTSAIFVKLIDAPVSIIAFYRLFFSCIMMSPILILNKRVRCELKSLTFKQYFLGAISGLLLAAHYVFWFESLNYTSVSSSTALVSLQPIFALIFSFILFKEKTNCLGIFGIILSILGSSFIGWQDFQNSTLALYGDFLALFAAFIITGYFFIGQFLRKNISVISYSFIGYGSSAFFLFLYAIFKNSPFISYSKETWYLLIFLSLFSTIFGQMLINWVLKWLSATTVSVVILTEVIWATLLSIIILSEPISSNQIIGIFAIVIGLIIYSHSTKLALKPNTTLP